MIVNVFHHNRNQESELCGWETYCDICHKFVCGHLHERTRVVTEVRDSITGEWIVKEVNEVLTLSDEEQFWDFINRLRDDGHLIPKGKLTTVGHEHRRKDSQVNLICKECAEKCQAA